MELLRQAASEATGRGFVKAEVRADARTFFYSDEAEFVHWRGVWFHLAGIELPPANEMKAMVARLSGAAGKVRRNFA